MNVTLLMAITINGFVAGQDDDTEWVKDIDALYKMTAEAGVAIMGKRTYDECVKYNAFPYKGALNIVMTHDKTLLTKSTDDVIFTDATPQGALQLLEQKGFDHALVIGGGNINGSFLKAGLINEIILDIHPMVMAKGIHLFEGDFPYQQLELMSFTKINDDLLQVKYRVKNNYENS
ncbi:MAG: dihydrofolate reductase family protein [Candidatus Gottesmanbacteria bacterium]|nr:dihydrofolate reductase family protein [Candidatus Gottesmanbacteria bacterium]